MTFHSITLTSLALASVCAAAPVFAQAPTYRVTDLNAAPGAATCVATAVNDAGVTVGACGEDILSNQGAAKWTGQSMTNLGKLPGGNYAGATAINALGVVIGDGDTGDFQPRPFVIVRGKMINVDPQGGANMHVVGLMDNGTIFGNYAKGLSGNTSSWQPVYYKEEKPGRYRRYELPRVPGGTSSANGAYLSASNRGGQAAGAVQNSLFGQKGAFWNNDAKHTVTVLEPLAGAVQSFAWGINDLGQAVGGSYIPFVGDRASLWTNDNAHSPVDLGTLAGDVASTAFAINTSGQVVGISRDATGGTRAFLYQDGSMLDLATLVAPEDGVWSIDAVFAINNAGQIVALGRSNGRWASVLLTPVVQ